MEFTNDEIRTMVMIVGFVVIVIIGIYVILNTEKIKNDPCGVCERGTGFKCQNFGLSPVYYQNGSLYRPESQPGFNTFPSQEGYSNVEKVCLKYIKEQKLYDINLSNLEVSSIGAI